MELSQERLQPTSLWNYEQARAVAVTVAAALIACMLVWLAWTFFTIDQDDPLLVDSTPGQLALWMTDQSELNNPQAILGQYARNRAQARGEDQLAAGVLLTDMKNGIGLWCSAAALLAMAGVYGLLTRARWTRTALLTALIGTDMLLFIIVPGQTAFTVTMLSIILMLGVLLFAPGSITKVLGFFVVLSSIFVVWEGVKAFAESVDYRITAPLSSWDYTTYPTLDDALDALQAGTISVVVADRSEVRDLMPAHPRGAADDTLPRPDLRYLTALSTSQKTLIFPVTPSFPGRLSAIVRAEDANRWTRISQLVDQDMAAVAGAFADERFLRADRRIVLLDLKIFNDLNLPHLQSIANAFMQPARRNGPLLLVRILGDAALFTWGEALLGFVYGSILGFALGTFFAHSGLMERSLLPFVVASQTVPILALAPMVVIWLGASPTSVSVIAAYLTFFPVTINTLRGLQSPNPTAIELMESYAASRWTIMWKLRFPAALPYIFTALKVSATASVVGAIIGELPSGISDGLGRAILNFSSDYSLISTPKLWASIIMAACVGIFFFVIVTVVEHFALRRYIRRG